MNEPERMSDEDVTNIMRSLTAAFIEGLADDPKARLFLKNAGIRLFIDPNEAVHEIAAAKRWVQQSGEPFQFRRE